MTNQLSVSPPRPLLPDIRLSVRLAAVVSLAADPHPDLGPQVAPVSEDLRTEAREALRLAEELCAPVAPEIVGEWLKPVSAAVRNPPSREQFAGRLSTIVMAVRGLPAAVFNSRTQRMAITEFQFWPAAADVYALLRPEAVPLLAKRDALRRIVGTPASAIAAREMPSEAEKAAVSATLAAHRQEQAAAQPERSGPLRATARPVSPEVLIAIYRDQMANAPTPAFRHLAELRLAALEGS